MPTECIKLPLREPKTNLQAVLDQIFAGHRYRNELVTVHRDYRKAKRRIHLKYPDFVVAEGNLNDAKAALRVSLAKMAEEKIRTGLRCASAPLREQVANDREVFDEKLKELRAVARAVDAQNGYEIDLLKEERNTKAKVVRAQFTGNRKRFEKATVRLAELRELLAPFGDLEEPKQIDTIPSGYKESPALYWGSYMLHDDAMKQSAGQPEYNKRGDHGLPKYVLFKREGGIGLRFQDPKKPFKTSEIFSEDPKALLRIKKPEERAWYGATGVTPTRRQNQAPHVPQRENKEGQGRRSAMKTTMRMIVRTVPEPVFAEWDMIMHRPLPEGEIAEAAVYAERVGSRTKWWACITVRVPERVAPATGNGIVFFNIGWRSLPSGEQRVLTWVDEHDRRGFITLDEPTMESLRRPSRIQSHRDRNFNEIKRDLYNWMKGRELPVWVRRAAMSRKAKQDKEALPTSAQAAAWIAGWKSKSRLAHLVITWRVLRIDGDEAIFGKLPDMGPSGAIKGTESGLEGWRHRDKHLWDYESNQRYKSRCKRKEDYRLIALDFAKRYDGAAAVEFNISDVAKKPNEEDFTDEAAAHQDEKARSNRQLCAPHILADLLKRAFLKLGKSYVEHDPKLLAPTKRCHACGFLDKSFNPAKSLRHRCPNCGAEWDQDENNCLNLRILHKTNPEGTKKKRGPEPDPNDDPNETKHAKSRRLARERKERIESNRPKP